MHVDARGGETELRDHDIGFHRRFQPRQDPGGVYESYCRKQDLTTVTGTLQVDYAFAKFPGERVSCFEQ